MARLPANVDFLASQFELTLGLPLLVWAWSRMSSWSRLAVWIISLTSATCLCFPSTCNSVLSSKCLEAYLIICWTTSCLQRCLAQTNRDHRSDSFSGAVKVIPDDQKRVSICFFQLCCCHLATSPNWLASSSNPVSNSAWISLRCNVMSNTFWQNSEYSPHHSVQAALG